MEVDDKVLGALIQLVLLSMFIERSLAFFFDWKRIGNWLSNRDLKPGIALVVSFIFCGAYDFNIFEAVFPAAAAPSGSKYYLSIGLTGLVVAGGSAGAIKLFQDVLGFNRQARDALRDSKVAQAEAKKLEAEAQRAEAALKKAEAEQRKAEADVKKTEADVKRTEADVNQTEANIKKAEADERLRQLTARAVAPRADGNSQGLSG